MDSCSVINDQDVMNIPGIKIRDLFSRLCFIIRCSKYCRKISVVNPDIGEPMTNSLAGL
jgi:hypothetical protein